MDGQSPEVVTADLTFACVESSPDLEPELAGGLGDGLSAADGSSWTVERGHESVAGGIDLPPSEPPELIAYRLVVSIDFLPFCPAFAGRPAVRCRQAAG